MRTGFTPRIPASVYEADRLAWRPPQKPEQPLSAVADTYVPVTELPIEQKIVILEARGGELAAELLSHIRTWGADEPKPVDYVEMIKRRAITKRGDDYVVTPGGLYMATQIMRALCKAIGIHRREPIRRGSRFTATQPCTCGEAWGLDLNQGHLEAQGQRAFAFHLKHVATTKAGGVS